MIPHHHPTPAVLTDYVSGALRPAFAAVVSAHVEGCPHCRAEVANLEALGGALIEDLEPELLDQGRLDAAMAALDGATPQAPIVATPTVDRIPFGPTRWLAPGMSIRKAKVGASGDLLYLLRLPAGVTTIPHGHQGVEFTAVLSGSYHDGLDRFSAGDFCEMNPNVEHQPQVSADSYCLCLIASEKPMRQFTTLGRMVHWLTGV
jgi:putative transcriptional regulator